MKGAGCWCTCEGWNDDDKGLGCYGWCTIRGIPITFNMVYRENCYYRKDKKEKQDVIVKDFSFIAGNWCTCKKRDLK
jgi:hypothetical protein